MKYLSPYFFVMAAFTTYAFAQQLPSPQQCTEQVAGLQKAITAIQAQRDRASNEQVNMAVQLGMMQDELAKLKAENEELKKKDAPPK